MMVLEMQHLGNMRRYRRICFVAQDYDDTDPLVNNFDLDEDGLSTQR